MATADEIRSTVERYVKLLDAGDADAIALLYAEDASVEDPVGSPPRRGRDTLRAFYAASSGRLRAERTGPVRVCGHEAAFPMLARVGSADAPALIDVIDVMTFDEDGRIASMRAFWSPDAIRSA